MPTPASAAAARSATEAVIETRRRWCQNSEGGGGIAPLRGALNR